MAADPTYYLTASVFDELGMRLVFLAPKMILLYNKKVYLHRDCFHDVVRHENNLSQSQKQDH